MEKKEAGLDFEGLGEAVVPNGEIGATDFFGERELGSDHAVGKAGGEVSDIHQTPALGGGGAGDYDHFIEVCFGGGFKQKGNIDGEPGIAGLLPGCPRQGEPGAADGGMQDGLEGLSLYWIREDNGPKGRPLQDSAGVEHSGAKMIPDPIQDGRIRGSELPSAAVCVKSLKCRVGRDQTAGKVSLACGNSSRDTQYWHAQ